MNNFIKYCKQNKKQLFNIIMLSIIPIYIIFTIIFPYISIVISKNIIVQIILIISLLYFIINIKKFKIEKIKYLFKKYIKTINKHILIKSITILIIIIIVNAILN